MHVVPHVMHLDSNSRQISSRGQVVDKLNLTPSPVRQVALDGTRIQEASHVYSKLLLSSDHVGNGVIFLEFDYGQGLAPDF